MAVVPSVFGGSESAETAGHGSDVAEGEGRCRHHDLHMVVSDAAHRSSIRVRLPCNVGPTPVAFDASYWTLSEDRVLLLFEWRVHHQRDREFAERRKRDKKLKLEDIPVELDPAQLVKDYRREAARNPKLFTHRRATGTQLLRRLQELPLTGTRYQLLMDDISKQMESDGGGEGGAGDGPSSSHLGNNKRGGISSPSNKKRNLYNAKLTVQLRSDGTQYDPVVALRQPLVRVSEKIRDDVMELLVIDDEELLESNPKDVSLAYDDQADELALYNTFGLFHPRFFLKLIEFSKEPNALAEERELRERVERLYKKQQDTIDELIKEMEVKKQLFFEKLQEEQERQIAELRESFNNSFERDMKQLKRMYDFHLENELIKLEAAYQEVRRSKAEYWDSEVAVARNLVERTGNIETGYYLQQLDRLQATCEMVFDAQTLPNLLLLADYLQVDQLRTCCIELIGKEWRKFRCRKELGCRILKDHTIADLLAKFSLDELRRLQSVHDHSLRVECIDKEIDFRKLILSEEYRVLTNDELSQKYTDPATPFPELLQEELARRHQAKQKVTLLTATASPHMTFSHDKLQGKTKKGHKYMTVQAALGKTSDDWGRVYCEFVIDELGKAPGCTMCFGWDRKTTKEENTQGLLPGRLTSDRAGGSPEVSAASTSSSRMTPPPPSADFACSLQSNGVFYAHGHGTFTQTLLETGDVVGMGLDLSAGSVLFTKNGDIIRSIGDYGVVSLHAERFELYPTITMYNARDSNEMAVSVNFSGPFQFPPPPSYLPFSMEKSAASSSTR